LPLVGEIAADGLSTRQFEDEIERRLKADDLLVSPPQVGVQLMTYQPFYVLGEVGRPAASSIATAWR
jgi:polysaccharide export outer membrane protein